MKFENNEAGPSTLPVCFLPPHLTTASPPSSLPNGINPSTTSHPSQYLHASNDLITRFGLLEDYDRFVSKCFGTDGSADGPDGPGDSGAGDGSVSTPAADSGNAPSTPLPNGTPNDPAVGDKPDREKKARRQSYKLLIRQIPGKHSYKKEDYLVPMIMDPTSQFGLNNSDYFGKSQYGMITNNLGDGSLAEFTRPMLMLFEVSPEGLKGWNANNLVLESAQAREDRKKRKELKKLYKAHQMRQAPQAGAVSATAPSTAAGTPRPSATGTPRGTSGGTPRPIAPVPSRVTSSAPTPRPAAPTPRPSASDASSLPTVAGVKRPLDTEPAPPVNLRAGTAGVRPRPVKKARVESSNLVPQMV